MRLAIPMVYIRTIFFIALSVAILLHQLSEGDRILGRIQSTTTALQHVANEISEASLKRDAGSLAEPSNSSDGEHVVSLDPELKAVNQATTGATTAGNASVTPSDDAASSSTALEKQAEVPQQDPISRFQAFLEKTVASASAASDKSRPSLRDQNSTKGHHAILHKLKMALEVFPKPKSAVAEPNSDILQDAKLLLSGHQHGKAMAHPVAIARALLQLAEHNTTSDGVVHVCGFPSGMMLASALFPDRVVRGCEIATAKASDIMVVSGRCKIRGYVGTILYW
jgi:hypothetical protein